VGGADLLYTVAFDQVPFETFTYPADSFSFTTPSIIPGGFSGMVGQIISIPDGEINGFMFTEVINESQTSSSSLFISRPFALSGVRGKIDEIFFQITASMNGPGIYPLPVPGDGYCIDAAPVPACLGISVPSGSLTIAEAVPEPAYFSFVAGVAALIGWISQRKHRFRLLTEGHGSLRRVRLKSGGLHATGCLRHHLSPTRPEPNSSQVAGSGTTGVARKPCLPVASKSPPRSGPRR